MAGRKYPGQTVSRRTLLRGMRWAPLAFLPAPLRGISFELPRAISGNQLFTPHFADLRLTPGYPSKSPLDDVVRLLIPGTDEFVSEKYAFEIERVLDGWGEQLKRRVPALEGLAKFVHSSLTGGTLRPQQETALRASGAIEVLRRHFVSETTGREGFLRALKDYFSPFAALDTAEFQIVAIDQMGNFPLQVRAEVRYDLVGSRKDKGREQRTGHWLTEWVHDPSAGWRATRWQATEETLSRAREPLFVDVTSHAFAPAESYRTQMLRGVDHWRTVLDAACGIDVYGNNGLAVGDFDNDGFDDLYVCQPSGLPNRLYRNRGDGTFEDVAEQAGVGVLDGTACALFADFENKGHQDLLVVCASGPLLFLNEGNGKFSLKRDAFRFARAPQGAFTHAAVADYDGDGRLDVYFCVYSYYVGLDQYRYPVPYFDARNGPPNFLFHNQGGRVFEDRTEAAGLNADNDRYSFACAWGAVNANARPDLYVANDFGRGNLYRNNADGTFSSVASEAGVEDPGAGMSAAWLDFDNDRKQDIYVANMWSAAGLRVAEQSKFHESEPEQIRGFYRQHARGNSLYRNLGNGKFQNVSRAAGVEMGRWAWCSDAWDFDHDGYADLYIANGYISGPEELRGKRPDASSFFWRQIVAKSPQTATPSANYERGWNAINELIRSDTSWNGNERNVFYLNNGDGTFSDISGVAGLDLPDDSRAFALADIDHDGRLEVILKNRTAPQIRVLRNAMKELGNSIAFRLRGAKSNRDAIGAAITLEAAGRRQTKYLGAGSGFLSQHTKEVFFGLGKQASSVSATIRWPSGVTQEFHGLPVNSRIEIQEGASEFVARPFEPVATSVPREHDSWKEEPPPGSFGTWLIEPLRAPDFSLPDLAGKMWNLDLLRGKPVLLYLWATASPACSEQMRLFQRHWPKFAAAGLSILAINLDDPAVTGKIRAFEQQENLGFPVLLATREMAAVYNIFYRYLFDRRRDLPIPAALLVDSDGLVVKIHQGSIDPEQLATDAKTLPNTPAERVQKALPFPGTLFAGEFQRNDFTYGVAFFQHGLFEQAAASFKQVIAAKPQEPEAYYNLGTLYLRTKAFADARLYLEQSVKLRPDYPEAWNNLGMIAAQQNRSDEAVRNFQESLRLRPDYAVALLNLGNFYRSRGGLDQAEKLLDRALQLEPENAEVNYAVGMLYARRENLEAASTYLQKAVSLRPDYADALNNLGVLFVRQQRYPEAEESFKSCIRAAGNFDQGYLNLARLYVLLKEKEKAREVLLALLKEQPEHKLAQQALAMLD